MIRRPPRSTQSRSSEASDVYKRQSLQRRHHGARAMSGTMKFAALFVLVLCTVSPAAAADDLVAGVSQDQIQIASQQTLQLYQLGAGNVQAESASTPNRLKAEPYRQAVIAQRKRDHLFIEQPDGVEFLGSTLFRVHVPVPAGAPRGQYTVEVYVIRNGMVMSVQSTPLFVDQIGLERRLYKLAFSWPVTYGLAAVLMALLMGWLSALVFRQT